MSSCLHKLILHRFPYSTIAPIPGGASEAELYRIHAADESRYILKKQPAALLNDVRCYRWLHGKVPVPEVIFHEQTAGFDLLCMTELPGHTLELDLGKITPDLLVSRYARSLRMLHDLPLDSEAPVQSLEDRLAYAKLRFENGLVDTDDWQPENRQYSPEALYQQLLSLQPSEIDLVFTHGDYGLGNLLYDNDRFTGFIDLANGGVADRYQDIALALRNIGDDLGEAWIAPFCKEYGLSEIDHRKTAFYILLDEFF